MRFKANYTTAQFEHELIINDEDSLTVPDMSYTIQELMEKFTQGNDPNVWQEGEYDENQDLDQEIEEYEDLTDIDEKRRRLEVIQKEFDEKAKIKQKQEEDDKKEFEKFKKSKKNDSSATTNTDSQTSTLKGEGIQPVNGTTGEQTNK